MLQLHFPGSAFSSVTQVLFEPSNSACQRGRNKINVVLPTLLSDDKGFVPREHPQLSVLVMVSHLAATSTDLSIFFPPANIGLDFVSAYVYSLWHKQMSSMENTSLHSEPTEAKYKSNIEYKKYMQDRKILSTIQ